MAKTSRLTVLSGLVVGLCSLASSGYTQNYAFNNGHWFDGEGFESRTVYVSDGIFSETKPDTLDRVFDLDGGYVVPPFAEAHNHNLDGDYGLEDQIQAYLRDGVLYAKMQSSIQTRVEQNRGLFDDKTSVDVVYAHAPITGTGGHPVKLRETFFDRGWFDGVFESKAEIEGQGYFIVDTPSDLDEIWPSLLANNPDFVKINLLHSEFYEERKNDPAYFGKKGLNPALLPIIIDRAHKDGFRVSTHIDTPTDFHNAVVAGVDEINHMPGRIADDSGLIAERDAELAAEKGIVVVTTASLISRRVKDDDPRLSHVRANMAANLRLLHDKGVTLAIGSDMFRDTSVGEAQYLKGLEVFSNLELLKIWVEKTPATIFPERRIGRLADGYEASFLALAGSPLDDFDNVGKIERRFKRGVELPDIADATTE